MTLAKRICQRIFFFQAENALSLANPLYTDATQRLNVSGFVNSADNHSQNVSFVQRNALFLSSELLSSVCLLTNLAWMIKKYSGSSRIRRLFLEYNTNHRRCRPEPSIIRTPLFPGVYSSHRRAHGSHRVPH